MKLLNKLPSYMKFFYNRVYKNATLSGILDDDRVSALLSLFQQEKILKDVLHDIPKNAHVLQIGIAFGPEVGRVYEKVEKHGKMDVYDVSDTQIKLAKEKHQDTDIDFCNYNAALSWDEKYDVVICYNLLQELPLITRQNVIDNVLDSLATGGKAIFVDCCKPIWWHPLKWPLFLFNRLYRPFAESLWNAALESFSTKKDKFRWYHTYYCGKMFQKTVAIRKILSNEDVRKLTKLFREQR